MSAIEIKRFAERSQAWNVENLLRNCIYLNHRDLRDFFRNRRIYNPEELRCSMPLENRTKVFYSLR